mmetsp:Transcript_105602/g.303738  ORF Transcript_105602/g.303738 Transcript_105602/m.303738 type:complete len:225 (+) Transcript_105602:277-951(+)
MSLLLEVFQAIPNELDYSDDEGAEQDGAQVIAKDRLQRGESDPRLSSLLREEPDGNAHRDQDLADGDEERIVPEEHEEGDREAGVEVVSGRRAAPTLRDAPLNGAHVVLPDRAHWPLVRALARNPRLAALGSELEEGAGWSCAIGLLEGLEVAGRRVVGRHLGEQERRRQQPRQTPSRGEQSLADGNQKDGGVVAQELRGDLVQRDGQLDVPEEAEHEYDPHTA